MINFEALYYPSFEPPAKWLKSFLLFFDKISSIVPSNVTFDPSEGIAELIDSLPYAFDTISPREEDITLDNLNFKRMRKAFKIIGNKNRSNKKEKETDIIIYQGGTFQIKGHIFLHDRKISDNMRSILNENHLIFDNINEKINNNLDYSDFSIVNKDAGDLILSYIAERISRRYGLHSITDNDIGFIVNSLDTLENKSLNDSENLLALSIINSQVPNEVDSLNIEAYKELRDAYSGMRETFRKVIFDLNNFYRLNKIEDKEHLVEKINEITKAFNHEFELFKKSIISRNIRRWLPIAITNLPVVLGSAFSGSKIIQTGAGIKIAHEIIREINQQQSDKNNLFRLMGKLERNVLNTTRVENLMLSEYIY